MTLKKHDNPLGDYPAQTPISKRKRRKASSMASNLLRLTEIQEQEAVIDYCRVKGLFVWATPNGGKRGFTAQRNAKREGMLSGVSDLTVMLPDKVLYIEMKRTPKRLKSNNLSYADVEPSEAQIDFIERIRAYPYADGRVCFGAKVAISFIEENL